MPRNCYFFCRKFSALYSLPKDESVRNQWLCFIFSCRPQQPYNPKLCLCSRHFHDDCFTNLHAYKTGFAQRLCLIEGSVPSLFGPNSSLQSRSIVNAGEQIDSGRLTAVKVEFIKEEIEEVKIEETFAIKDEEVNTEEASSVKDELKIEETFRIKDEEMNAEETFQVKDEEVIDDPEKHTGVQTDMECEMIVNAGEQIDSGRLTAVKVEFIKEEIEEVKIEETFAIKDEEVNTEEASSVKDELKIEETFRIKDEEMNAAETFQVKDEEVIDDPEKHTDSINEVCWMPNRPTTGVGYNWNAAVLAKIDA
ncbi:hypothetical protein DNTS_021082 [Danionella cerebrum]|uniref:THAP domain-containing protein 1 n=1 Tax=Danionella cerebrum TaxID=2873325 RepID=A0A553Q284_9TELE|nr:hypothetical protein DNTS_021082 [Danionella translucida]